MSADRRFERALPGILADLGAGPTDDYSQLLARTARTRQRPAWSFPERWLPMDLAVRPSPAVITPRRLVAVVALLLLASLIGVALLAGSQQPPVPPPFGVARNGVIAFTDEQGRIWSGDPVTMTSRLLVDSTGNSKPIFSPDGRRLAFVHDTGSAFDFIVARSDATQGRAINPKPESQPALFQWSPDSRSVVFTTVGSARILRYDADRAGPATMIVQDADQDLENDTRYMPQVQSFFRPPSGDEVLTIGKNDGHDTLIVTSLDGARRSVIVDDSTFIDIINAMWSPDGSRIAFNSSRPDERFTYHTWIINADGSGLRRLFADSLDNTDQNPQWSPDGKRIALQRWYNPAEGVDPRRITIVGVDSGGFSEVGELHPNGYIAFGWSPDGRSIIEVPGPLPGGEAERVEPVLVVDAASGTQDDPGWLASAVSWQRQAP